MLLVTKVESKLINLNKTKHAKFSLSTHTQCCLMLLWPNILVIVVEPVLQANFSQSKNANFQNLRPVHFRKFEVWLGKEKHLIILPGYKTFIDLFMYIGIRNFECQSQSLFLALTVTSSQQKFNQI